MNRHRTPANRHRTPAVEVAVVIVLVAASVIFVVLKRRPSNEALTAGPLPEQVGLSWQWHAPGDAGAVAACQPAAASAAPDAPDRIVTWQGATVDCLELAGVSWDERWQNLAELSLRELAEASLGVRNVPRGTPPVLPPDVCTNPGARDIVAHLVRCALPHPDQAPGLEQTELAFCDEHVSFPGGFGLAGEWLHKPLKEIEGGRERVSACLMAHANAVGQQVRIRLETPALDTPMADAWPTLLEGAFAGNLFPELDGNDPHHLPFGLHACQADGYDQSKAPPGRVCTLDASYCGFARTRCANATAGSICARKPVAPGPERDFFAECSFPGAWQADDDEVVTVYVSPQDRIGRR
jgi:hypothetical protein